MGKDHELLEAARTGNLQLVEKLIFSKSKSSSFAASLGIRVGAHVNCQDQNGYTPLHHASLNGHSAIVHVLLEAGASVNVPDYKGSCPLHLAAWNGKAEIVKFLLTIGPNFASVNEQNGDKETALHCAAQHGHTDSAQILLDNHADAQIRNIRDESALDLASQYGRLEVVRMLLTYYPKLLAHSPERFTPLHLASRNGHRGVVELLLVHGADINKVGANGTALHEAALFGKYDVVSLLLKRGAETGSKDSSGRTALELVSQLDTQISREIAKLIIERMQDGDDYEPLRSIITSTPQKKDMKAKNQFDQPTNVFASGAKVSRHLSRSFGEADLPSRDPSRGRPSITTPFRYSRHSQLSPDVSKSPSSHRMKHSFLRRSSSARSARSLPRLVSSASFHGNRSLHSFSAHRKKSHDAISIQDWSIRQHHPSIDMFPVTPTRPSQTSRRTSASEPSSPQLGASFVSPIHLTDSPELEFHSAPFGLDDDTVFLPGTPTSARPSFETFLPQTPKHEPKAVIPLKPPADENTSSPQKSSTIVSIIIKQPTIEDELSPSETELSAISQIKNPPPLPKKSTSSPPCGVEPLSPPIGPEIHPFSSSTVTDNEGSISKTREDSLELPSPSKSFEGHHESSILNTSLSSTSDLSPTIKSPGAPRKPQRHKPVLTPPPLPPKPAHMLQEPKKPRPPSPTNPPPMDDEISDDEADDGGEKQEEKREKTMGQSSSSTVSEAFQKNKEPTSITTTRTTETILPVPSSSPRSSSSTITKVPSPTDTITSGISEKITFSQNDAAENKSDAREREQGPKQTPVAPTVTKISLQGDPGFPSTPQAPTEPTIRSDISVSQEGTKSHSETQRETKASTPSQNTSKAHLKIAEQDSPVGSSEALIFKAQTAKPSIRPVIAVSQEGTKTLSDAHNEKIFIPSKTSPGVKSIQQASPAEGAQTPSESRKEIKVFIPSKASSGETSTLQAPPAKPSIRLEKSVSQEGTKTRSDAEGEKVSKSSKTTSKGDSSRAPTSQALANPVIHRGILLSPQEGTKTQSEVQGNKVFLSSKNISALGSAASSKTHSVTRAGTNAPSNTLEMKVAPNSQGIEQMGHPGQTRGDPIAPHTTTTKISPPEPQNPSVIRTTHLIGETSKTIDSKESPNVTKTPGGTNERSAVKNLPRDPSAKQASKNEKPTKLTYSTEKGHVVGSDVPHVTALPSQPHSGKSGNSLPTLVTKPVEGSREPPQITSNKQKTPNAPPSTIQVLVHASEESTRGKQAPDIAENPLSPTLRSPSPPFSPPSPNTAMLQVSSALQKAMPPSMKSSATNPLMHSSIQTTKPQPPPSGTNWTPKPYTKALIEQNRQKPEIPKKKPSILQHLKTRDTQNAKIIIQSASPTSRLSQNLTNIAKDFPKQSPFKKPPSPNINSTPVPGSKFPSKTRKLGHNGEMNKIIAPKPFTKISPSQKPQSPTVGHEQKRTAKLNTLKQASKSPPQSQESKTLLRPQSGLHYTATEVKRARICSTRSVTEISASQTYGEYDNLSGAIGQLSRSKRSSSLGPQVATPFPVKPMQVEIEIQTIEPVRKVSDAFTQTYPPKVPHCRRSLQKSKSVDRVHHDPKLTNSPTIKPLGDQNPVQQQPESFVKRPDTSPRPVPRIKPPLVTTPPMSAQTRRLQRPKKPAKPAYLSLNSKAAPSKKINNPNEKIQSPAKSYFKERTLSPHSALEKSSLADKSVISVLSLDTSDDWNDALSDRTEEFNIPKEVRKYRGLIRGSSLSYRSRLASCGGGARDPSYDSDEFEYDYHFDSKAAYSRVNASLQPDEEIENPRFNTVVTKEAPNNPGGFYHTQTHLSRAKNQRDHSDLMEVDFTQILNKKLLQHTGEPGEKRRREETGLLFNKALTVTSQGFVDQTPSRDSSYDNNNNNNNTSEDNQEPVPRSSSSPLRADAMAAVPTLPSPMSDGLPDFGKIVDTVTAVRKKTTSPHESTSGVSSSSSSQSSTLAKQDPITPFNENDEWAQIANVMKSVGSSLNKGPVYAQEFEETFWRIMTGSDLPRRVGTWLSDLNVSQYEEVLCGNGFDNISFLASDILEEQDLIDMNIQNEAHRRRMLDSAKNLPKIRPLTTHDHNRTTPSSVGDWLQSIALEEHEDTFHRMGFTTMEKVSKIRDMEIAGIIPLRGHRKRIRASLGPLHPAQAAMKTRSMSLGCARPVVNKSKSSPPLPRSPLLDTVNFFKDYSKDVTVKTTRSASLNVYGTTSSSSSALTNYSSLSDQVVPTAISEEPDSHDVETKRQARKSSVTKYARSQSANTESHHQRRRSKEQKTDFVKPPPYNSGSLNSRDHNKKEKFDDFLDITNNNREEDLLTLAINRLTDGSVKKVSPTTPDQEDKENLTMSSESDEIRVPDARRASFLSNHSELVLRPPNEATEEGVTVSSWCHDPEMLIKSCCNYQAYYLGSMLVQEVKGVESTVEACAKMKKSTDSMKKIPTVTLSISYRGVKFIDSKSKHEIAEHEIHNISFASQDADDLSTLAYITRDARTDNHYCHVFRVTTLDIAYEIILTLGQAFEVAYQLILKEKALQEGTA